VRARRDRRSVRSDWMEMERQRGISISSAVLRFEYRGAVCNLLDTPGHRDFSEDTYRVLSAVDAAVMVLDSAKGVEDQTLKLFEVCRQRGVPLISFLNKYDRPGLGALELLDEIEAKIGLRPTPVTWPVGVPGHDFRGVVDRRDGRYVRFDRTAGGATAAPELFAPWDPAEHAAAAEELALLDEIGADFDEKSFIAGESTPVFFGSALTNFGVRLLLDAVVDAAPPPSDRIDSAGRARPVDGPFSAFVFKVQANMDPNHRDRIAFARVCSGRFERGMTATVARTDRPFALRYAHDVLGQERETLDEAWPGDVIGLVNATDLGIGDTLYVGDRVAYPPIPTFAPEHFVAVRNRDTSRYKQFRRGLEQLDEEGVVQVLRSPELGDAAPVLAAVGPMQFDVASHRMANEFGTPIELGATQWKVARLTDAEGEKVLGGRRECEVMHRADGSRYALFRSEHQLAHVAGEHPDVRLDAIVV
jgi:peptide chain release factor 3